MPEAILRSCQANEYHRAPKLVSPGTYLQLDQAIANWECPDLATFIKESGDFRIIADGTHMYARVGSDG